MFSQTAFGGMAAAAGKASLASAGLLAPLAGVAAVAGTAYVAMFKWGEIPTLLKPILLVASPLVFSIRAMATAWKLATAPVRLFVSALDTAKSAVVATAKAIPRLVGGIVSSMASLGASAVRAGTRLATSLAKGFITATAAAGRFASAALSSVSKLGSVLQGVGGELTTLANVLVDPMRRAGDEFGKAGTQALALATAAGVSVATMTSLGYAAEKAGSSADAVAAAMQNIDAAASQGAGVFRQLGLDMAELAKLDAGERFMQIGIAIASLESPLERAAAAQAAFGAGGEQLVGMFAKGRAGIEQMRIEAERLGLVMSGPQAKAAAELTDATAGVQRSMLGLWRTLGAAVAPQLTEVAKMTMDVVKSVTAWASKNGPLIAQVFKVASAVATVGTALTGVASALALASPGLLALGGALAAGWVAWGRYGEAAQKALSGVMSILKTIQTETMAVLGGIGDALKAGDLEAAVGIAWLGVQRAWIEGLRGVASITGDTLGGIFNALAAGEWRGAVNQTWTAIQSLFVQGVGALDRVFVGLQDTIDAVITTMRQQLNVGIHELAKFASSALAQVVEVSKAVEAYDPTGLLKSRRLDLQLALKGITSAAATKPGEANKGLSDAAAGRANDRAAGLAGRQAGRDARLAALAAQAGQGQANAGNAAGVRSDVEARLARAVDAARLARMMAEQRPAADLEQRNRLAAAAQGAASGPASTTIGGATFSASALTAQNGAGLNVQKEIAAATKAMAKDIRRLAEADGKRGKEAAALALVPVA
ncbi:MAG: hypothetical protein U0939_21935 [Pirellulales bacterium]